MTVYALWHGGTNYAIGYVDTNTEVFPSIAAAGDALKDRARIGHHWPQSFTYADGRTDSTLTPCADEGPSMTVWLSDPRGDSDPYPDRLITIGPRGGVRMERT